MVENKSVLNKSAEKVICDSSSKLFGISVLLDENDDLHGIGVILSEIASELAQLHFESLVKKVA